MPNLNCEMNIIYNFCFFLVEMMAAGIREEMRRLHRRKQLHFNPNDSHLDRESSSDSPGSPSTNSFAATYHQNHRDKPLFTFRQVSTNLNVFPQSIRNTYYCRSLNGAAAINLK